MLVGSDALQTKVEVGCGCDLMSDVLAFAKPGTLLLTGLTNPQAVRAAEMAEMAAICFVRGKEPDAKTLDLARSKSIPILVTALPMFEACGRLHAQGLAGI